VKLPKILRQKKQRGKAKSPEQKFKEKKAKVDAFLLDSWLKQLRDDPALAARIAEQKYGSEMTLAQSSDGEYEHEAPDLLSVLREAKEAKELLRDELGESTKGSWMRDFAEIMRNLPAVLQGIGSISPATLQQFTQPVVALPRPQQISQPPRQEKQQLEQPDFNEVKLETIMGLLELSPEEAWKKLNGGWQNYLRQTSYEDLEQKLKGIGEANPEVQPHIDNFLKQNHHWLQQLVEIAHRSDSK
jgi:hypothetical protein